MIVNDDQRRVHRQVPEPDGMHFLDHTRLPPAIPLVRVHESSSKHDQQPVAMLSGDRTSPTGLYRLLQPPQPPSTENLFALVIPTIASRCRRESLIRLFTLTTAPSHASYTPGEWSFGNAQ